MFPSGSLFTSSVVLIVLLSLVFSMRVVVSVVDPSGCLTTVVLVVGSSGADVTVMPGVTVGVLVGASVTVGMTVGVSVGVLVEIGMFVGVSVGVMIGVLIGSGVLVGVVSVLLFYG